jgi:glycerol-3-phosphate cytidylyltransferase
LKRYKIGYTTGVYDLFHVGHLNILQRAKALCDYLIVGVTIDELVSYKAKSAIIPFEDRFEIIKSINCVDKAVPQDSMDKFDAWKKYNFNAMFVGSDWQNTETWLDLEKKFLEVDVKIEYFEYTSRISSSILRDLLLRDN